MSTFIYGRASWDPRDKEGSIKTQEEIALRYLEQKWIERCAIAENMRMAGKSKDEIAAALAKYPDEKPTCTAKWQGEPFDPVVLENNIRTKIPLAKRPKGGIMCALLKPGDHVIVTRIDRMIREFDEFVHIFKEWSNKGIFLHVVRDFGGLLDHTNPMGWALVHIRAIIGEMEKRILRERTIEGRAFQAQTGERSRALAGLGMKFVYRQNAKGVWCWHEEVDHEERAIVFRIVELRNSGVMPLEITKLLNQHGATRQKLRKKKGAKMVMGRYHPKDYVEERQPWNIRMVRKAIMVGRKWLKLIEEAQEKKAEE